MTTTAFFIYNDWNIDTLSAAGDWVNDGRTCYATEAEATQAMNDHIALNPDEAGRLRVSGYEVEA